MEYVIDRFEGEYAVLEVDLDKFVNIPKILVKDAKEKDIVKIEILKDKTQEKTQKITKLVDQLFTD